jgi:hypothetical protein
MINVEGGCYPGIAPQKQVSGHKIRESRHKNKYLATKIGESRHKTDIWPQNEN